MYRAIQTTVFVVLWFVKSSVAVQTVQVAIGQTAHLYCIVDITGSIHVEWINPYGEVLTYDDKVYTQDLRFAIQHPYVKEWILKISNVRNSDAGNYTCRIGPIPEINNYVELIVSTPPEITYTSGTNSYKLNSTANLSCVTTGSPKPKVTWYRIENHQLIELRSDGDIYQIKSVNLSTAGVYECHASNGVPPTAKAALEVHVLFAPIAKVPYKEVIQEAGKWTHFSCLVTMNPAGQMLWMRDGKKIENTGSYLVTSLDLGQYQHLLRLSIDPLSYSDFGDYECHAENKYGKDNSQMTLSGEQRKKASVISKPRDVTAAVGEDVLFNCSVLHLPTEDQLVWWHRSTNDTRKLFESSSLRQNSMKSFERAVNSLEKDKHDIIGQYNLLIRRTNFSDEGLYICQITGHENFSAALDVIPSREPSYVCQEYPQESFNLNTILIILGVIVVVLLIVAIIVIVLVCRLLVRKSQKDEEYLHPVQLNAKVSKLDQ